MTKRMKTINIKMKSENIPFGIDWLQALALTDSDSGPGSRSMEKLIKCIFVKRFCVLVASVANCFNRSAVMSLQRSFVGIMWNKRTIPADVLWVKGMTARTWKKTKQRERERMEAKKAAKLNEIEWLCTVSTQLNWMNIAVTKRYMQQRQWPNASTE